MNNTLEHSIKDKIRNLSKAIDKPFSELWQRLILERFLVRLSISKYRNNFIFKGGMLLSQFIELGRGTVDIDFLAQKLNLEKERFQNIFKEITLQNINDGFKFENIKVKDIAHPHMKYPGFCITMIAYLGNTKTPLSIDIGVGDVVTPINKEIELLATSKGSLFEKKIILKTYSSELIFAEKLETLFFRNTVNSRMKDYHDLYMIINEHELLNIAVVEKTIKEVFEHRQTKLELPIKFSKEGIDSLNSYWKEHHRGLLDSIKSKIPNDIQIIIDSLNNWLKNNTKLFK